MERLIDIKQILIISQTQFEELITSLGLTLSVENPAYLATYLVANIFAYMFILFFIYLAYRVMKFIFKKRRVFFKWYQY